MLGYIEDVEDNRDWFFDTHPVIHSRGLLGVGRSGEIASLDLSQHVDAIQRQKLNSCVGHSIANAAVITAGVEGVELARPSALWAYSLARLAAGPPITDTGCMFRHALRSMRDFGLVAESRWPETEAEANNVPPLDAFVAGDTARVGGFYRIKRGADAPMAMRLALMKGLVPMFGMVVDDAYLNLRGSGIYERGGKAVGGHAQVVVGYSKTRDAFRVLNSWGEDWGDGGFAWIASSFFETETFADMWVMTLVPKEIR
jgi:hypothetical protein